MALGCSGAPASQSARFSLAKIDDVTVAPGQQVLVKIVVVSLQDMGVAPVMFYFTGLPSFASTSGNTITFAPGVDDTGTYPVTVLATDGTNNGETSFMVTVAVVDVPRNDSDPVVTDDDGGPLGAPLGFDAAFGVPRVHARGSDSGDSFRLAVEAVTGPLTGNATHVSDWATPTNASDSFTVSITGSSLGQVVHVQAWLENSHGQRTTPSAAVSFTVAAHATRSGPDVRACAAGSVDVTSDPANCGACDHSCRGVACVRSVCAPTLILPSTPNKPYFSPTPIGGVQVDDRAVYWLEEGLMAIPLDGGPVTVLEPMAGYSLSIDATYAYMSPISTFAYDRFPLTGGPLEPIVFPLPTELLEEVPDRVYFVDGVNLRYAANAPNSAPATLKTFPAPLTDFLAEQAGVFVATDAGELYYQPADGSAEQLLTTGFERVHALATDASNVYVAHGDPPATCLSQTAFPLAIDCAMSSQIAAVPRVGGTVTALASVGGSAQALRQRDGYLYWTNGGRWYDLSASEGAVMRLPVTGGTPLIIAEPFSGIHELALDGQYAYFFDDVHGLMRAPR